MKRAESGGGTIVYEELVTARKTLVAAVANARKSGKRRCPDNRPAAIGVGRNVVTANIPTYFSYVLTEQPGEAWERLFESRLHCA